MFPKLIRIGALGLLVACSVGLRPAAQQRDSGLTQPPRPTPPASMAAAPAGPFEVGEKLSFNVSWSNFVTAARLELEVAEQGAFFGRDGYQLRTKVETMGYARSLFVEVDNLYVSYVDVKTLLPYRVENATRQGVKREDDSIIFDQQRGAARYGEGSELSIPPGTYDLPSLVYALRQRNLKAGATHKFSALFGKEVIEVEAEVKESERVITQAGTYQATRVEINAKGKKTNLSKYRVQAWFSNDAQRLPVLITARPPFGEVRAELSSAALVPRPKMILSQQGKGNQGLGPLIASNERPASVAFEVIREGEMPGDFGRHLPFAIGERLNYDVSWLNFASVGKVSFEVRQQGRIANRRVIEFASEAATTGAARAIINLSDQFLSYADLETLAPVRTDLRLHEGKRQKQVTADYDWAAKSVRLNNGTVIAVPPRSLDLVSLFYTVRAADLRIGATHTFPFLDTNHRPRTVTVRVMKQERIGGPLGPQDTLQLDVFSHDANRLIAQAWVTNDARRLPIYVVARPGFGEIRLQLTGMPQMR